ncbi:MAG TPA: TOBE domain-containing protein [Candidatus Binatia bacterium]|jgi:translation initiation factor IF-1|nr:TOBE domain-containing protein [Candidatus Binatia bacterium]
MQRDAIAASGTVARLRPDSRLQVRLDNGHQVAAAAPGGVRIAPGDRVTVELRSSDLSQGRITTWAK